MFVRAVLRLIRVVVVLVGLVTATAAVACYLALQEPAFYSDLHKHPPTANEVKAAKTRLEQVRADYVLWRRRLQLDQPIDPALAVHEVRFSDAHLNAVLASETISLAGGALEDPRLRVTPGGIDFACGVVTPVARCVFSAELTPELTPDGVLTLRLESARIGRLPLPCQTLVGFLPRERSRLSGSLYLDLTATKPLITLDLADKAKTLLAQSVECSEGELAVRFVPQRPEG